MQRRDLCHLKPPELFHCCTDSTLRYEKEKARDRVPASLNRWWLCQIVPPPPSGMRILLISQSTQVIISTASHSVQCGSHDMRVISIPFGHWLIRKHSPPNCAINSRGISKSGTQSHYSHWTAGQPLKRSQTSGSHPAALSSLMLPISTCFSYSFFFAASSLPPTRLNS